MLDIPADAVKKMSGELPISYTNTFNNSDNAAYNFQYYNYNSIEKIEKLYETIALLKELLMEKKM